MPDYGHTSSKEDDDVEVRRGLGAGSRRAPGHRPGKQPTKVNNTNTFKTPTSKKVHIKLSQAPDTLGTNSSTSRNNNKGPYKPSQVEALQRASFILPSRRGRQRRILHTSASKENKHAALLVC